MLGIKNKLTLAAIIAAIVMFGVIGRLIQVNSDLKADNARQTKNMEQITAETQRQLSLKADEYESLNAEWKDKIDSIRSDYDIKLKQVQQATVAKIVYRDTGSVKIVYGEPKIVYMDSTKSDTYEIPVTIDDGCWGLYGTIQSHDINSKLDVTERKFTNSIQLIDYWDRRWFLGKKRHNFVAVSDCGDLDITQIDFVKK